MVGDVGLIHEHAGHGPAELVADHGDVRLVGLADQSGRGLGIEQVTNAAAGRAVDIELLNELDIGGISGGKDDGLVPSWRPARRTAAQGALAQVALDTREATARTAWPAIFVIDPGGQTAGAGLFDHSADGAHKFRTQKGLAQPLTDMHVKATPAIGS